jgi:hypothetical protein
MAIGRNIGNPYLNVRYIENSVWGGWNKISAGLADNLTGNPNISVGTINSGAITSTGEIRSMGTSFVGMGASWDHFRIWHDGGAAYFDAGGAENGIVFRIDATANGYPAPSYPEKMRLAANGNLTTTGSIISTGLNINGNSNFNGNVGIGTSPDAILKLDVNGNSRISGELIGAYNCVKRITTYFLPYWDNDFNCWSYTFNYSNYLSNNSTSEFAFKIYVYDPVNYVANNQSYIGSVFITKVSGSYYYRVVDHHSYGVYTPVISTTSTYISLLFVNLDGMSNKKIVFENIAFSNY